MIAAVNNKNITSVPPQVRRHGASLIDTPQKARVMILILGLSILTGLAVKGADPDLEQGFSEPSGCHSLTESSPCI